MDEAELSRQVHDGEIFEKQSFAGMDLAGANLGGGVFSSCSFKGADLRGASLGGVDLTTATLRGTRLDVAGAVQLAEQHGAVVEP